MTSLQKKPLFHLKNDYLKVFLLCLILATAIFIPFLIYDKGYFLYYGDFNVQQIPFYKHAQEIVTSGKPFWDWNTDLGANFIGSYSFYLLGSPFFWLTTLFPSSVVPLLMAPLLILKFACAGLTGFAFIKRFMKSANLAIIGALLYAFSGFMVYNIFFNHFHEAVIIFPLMLVALEETVINGRRGWFAVTIFLAATMNYFFFVGQVVFIIIYFILRCMCDDFPITFKSLFILIFESIIGVAMSCMLLLPAALAIIDNPRTSSFYTGMNLFMFPDEQRYGLILQSLFFPPDIPARPNFFPDSNAKWSSVSAFLPLFSMTGVIVFVKNHKNHWLKRILLTSIVMAMVPILNSTFYAFNSSYYARWFYMPTLMMALATCIALENTTLDFKFGMRITIAAVAIFTLLGVVPTMVDGKKKWFSMPPYPERFWGYVAIAVGSLVILFLLLTLPRHSKIFIQSATAATCLVIFIYSVMVIGTGKENADDDIYTVLVEEGLHGAQNFTLDDSEFYRVDEHEAIDNMPMFWNMPTIQAFHSIVPVSVMDFYDSIGVERNVASRPEAEFYGVRALTSVKYLFCRTSVEKQPEIMGFEKIDVQNNYNVYENKCFIPMGFTYDHYVTPTDYDAYAEKSRDKLLLDAMWLSDEDANRYSDLLTPLDKIDYPTLTQSDYVNACTALRKTAGYEFDYTSDGFTSKINLARENLVFYSVPFEKGWSAKVNGEATEVIKSNVGFMAVKAPMGDNMIEFHYETPGLKSGTIITISAATVLALYLLLVLYMRKKYPAKYFIRKHAHKNELEYEAIIKTKDAYISSVSSTNLEDEKQDK